MIRCVSNKSARADHTRLNLSHLITANTTYSKSLLMRLTGGAIIEIMDRRPPIIIGNTNKALFFLLAAIITVEFINIALACHHILLRTKTPAESGHFGKFTV